MDRRQMLFVLAAAPVVAFGAPQASRMEGDDANLGTPWRSVNVAKDANKVYEFFHFTCSFCRQMDESFNSWGQTIPAPLSFEKVPICHRQEDVIAAMAYYAVKEVAPEKLSAFVGVIFYLVQNLGWELGDPNTYREAIRQVGIDRVKFNDYIGRNSVAQAARRATDLTQAYRVDQTPSIAISGRFITHAGYTAGNYETLIKLANGLISRQLAPGDK